MNDWYRSWLVETERRADEVAEAEKYRLVKQAGLIQPKTMMGFWRWLYHLGALLMKWGVRLQSHYQEWINAKTDHALPETPANPRTGYGL